MNFDEEKEKESENKEESESSSKTKLTEAEGKDMCEWFKVTLGTKVRDVKTTNRLSDSPAIVTDHESGALRRMMRMVVSYSYKLESTHV